MNLSWLHTDNRGDIYSIEGKALKYPEVAMFITKAGKARGGCIHKDSNEFSCIISGVVVYQIGDMSETLSNGQVVLIPKNTPHYFISLTDSVVLEWGAKPEEKKEKHPEFRAIVDRINDTTD